MALKYNALPLSQSAAQPGEGNAPEDLIHMHKYLRRGNKEDKAALLSVVPIPRARAKRHNIHKILLNDQTCFSVQMVKQCNILPREVVVSISGNIQNSRSQALANLLICSY